MAAGHRDDDLFEGARKDDAVRLPAYEQNLEGRGQQGFEGAEKTLDIEFDPNVGHDAGLRAIRREQWDAILEQVTCRGTAAQERLYRCLFSRNILLPCVDLSSHTRSESIYYICS